MGVLRRIWCDECMRDTWHRLIPKLKIELNEWSCDECSYRNRLTSRSKDIEKDRNFFRFSKK